MLTRVAAVLIAALALAGCGNERAPIVDVVRPDKPQGYKNVVLDDVGIEYRVPFNWTDVPNAGARVSGFRNKTATVAVFRYVREEPIPKGKAELEQVKGLLEARVKQRDPSFELEESVVTKRAGADAVELTGRQTIAGLRYAVRSSHVFKDGTEVVVDAMALPEDFERVDATVFLPALRSLELKQPKEPRR